MSKTPEERAAEKEAIRQQWEADKAELAIYKEQLRLEREAAKREERENKK